MLGEYRHEAENQRELMVVAFEEVEIPNCNGGDYRDARAAAREIAEADVDAILEAGRQAAEELVKRNAHAIEALAHALLAARWCELSGEEAERVLVQSGVKRTGGVSRYPAPEITQQRPAQGAPSYGYERRGGRIRPVLNPDPARAEALFQRRCDGGFL